MAADAPSQAGSMRIYRDPETGRIGAPPAAAPAGEPARPAERTNPPPSLIGEPVTAPAGGVKINLQGRYRAAVTRHAGGSGPATLECVGAGAAAHE